MARYRKVDPRIWNDAKFRGFSDRGKLAFLFVLTHPHQTSLGAMRATVEGLAAEIGWRASVFSGAIQHAIDADMIEYDASAGFIGVANFLKYNAPESPNVVTSWREVADMLPECVGKAKRLAAGKAFCESKGQAFVEAFAKAFDKAMPIQEQEQEQEQEQDISDPKDSDLRSETAQRFQVAQEGSGEVARLFRVLGAGHRDGALLWRVIALRHAGQISESDLWDSAEAVRVKQPRNRLGYFRAVLAERIGADRLNTLLAAVSVPHGFDCGPPKHATTNGVTTP